jgi:CheY-like chemotaxis protein
MDRKTILAVDDSETALALERAIIGPSFTVMMARSGEEAVARARAHRPHLVLMDFEMPGIDGLQAARELRALPGMSTTPIILVTSHSEAACLEAAFRAGCTDYVIKPVEESELMLKIRTYLGQDDSR